MAGPFAQITSGPATSTGQNTNQQALIFDKNNNIVESVGIAGMAAALQSALFIQTAQTALSAITTAQNLFNKTLGAGVLNKQNRTLTVSGALIYTSPGSTTPTFTISVLLGGVTLCAVISGAINTTASTNMPVQFQFQLNVATPGSAGTIESHGNIQANLTANTPGGTVTQTNDTNTAVSAAVNLTTALALQIQVSATSTITSMQLRQLEIELTY